MMSTEDVAETDVDDTIISQVLMLETDIRRELITDAELLGHPAVGDNPAKGLVGRLYGQHHSILPSSVAARLPP